MIQKYIKRMSVFSCAFFAAGIAFSAVVSESFNNKASFDLLDEKWSGDGVLKEETPSPLSAGAPIGTKDDETAKVLELEGEVVCANETGKQVDFLLNVSSSSDELPAGFEGVQIAVAVGTSETLADDDQTKVVPLMLYGVKKNELSAQWFGISSVKIGTWIRVTLDFDYGAGRCKVSVDGIPVVSEDGSFKADGSGGKGAWYKLAVSENKEKIASLTFIGSAKIDDVVVNDEVSENRFANIEKPIQIANGVTENVSLNDLKKWGITPDMAATAKVDDSGLTVAEKLECGLRPDDGKKFQLTDMVMRKESVDGVVKTVAKIKFPGSQAAIGRYKVTARDSAGKNVSIASTTPVYDEEKGEVSMDVIIPDNAERIIFINVTADASTPQAKAN